MLHVLWATGMHVRELSRLTIADVSLDKGCVRRPRLIPLPRACRAAIAAYIEEERGNAPGPLFLSSRTGQAFHEQTGKHIVRELGVKAGLSVGALDFRRSFVARLTDCGVPGSVIVRLTGAARHAALRYSLE